MSETLRQTAADFDARLRQLDRQIANLTKTRADVAEARQAIDSAVNKLPAAPAKPKAAKSDNTSEK